MFKNVPSKIIMLEIELVRVTVRTVNDNNINVFLYKFLEILATFFFNL